ncbi:autophagy protein 5 [Entomortierella lignicola]|nr:autophagy protein 5 [Entomortierella lignicola]
MTPIEIEPPFNPIAKAVWEGSIPIEISWDPSEARKYNIKEPVLLMADYLRNGSTKKVMNMSKSDQTKLWDGMWKNSFDLFWGMNQKLVLNDGVVARYLPVRIYLPETCPVIQEPVSPINEEGEPRTLRQILNIALPDLFPLENKPCSPAKASVLIHGIVPNLDASSVWFAQTMAYPDNFLHLVVIINI